MSYFQIKPVAFPLVPSCLETFPAPCSFQSSEVVMSYPSSEDSFPSVHRRNIRDLENEATIQISGNKFLKNIIKLGQCHDVQTYVFLNTFNLFYLLLNRNLLGVFKERYETAFRQNKYMYKLAKIDLHFITFIYIMKLT